MSGRKNNLHKYQTVTNGAMASNITSTVTSLAYLDNIGYQFNIIGTPTGSIAVQVSADYAQDEFGNVTNPGHWIALSINNSTSIAITTGSPSPIYLDLNQLSAPWIRSVYTATGGTGTLNAFITAKML